MYLCITKTFILYFMCGSCIALTLPERGAEFIEMEDSMTEKKYSSWKTVLGEQPVAILIELQEPLLEKIKKNLENDDNGDATVDQTTLATYDSMGLREVSYCNDSLEFREGILSLRGNLLEKEIFNPAIHALTDLLKRNLPQGTLLLVTMSRPMDEDFVEPLLKALAENKIKLSVLWAGDEMPDDYFLLKDISIKTGGKFEYLQDNSGNFFKLNSEIINGNIKFPGDINESSGGQMPSLTRMADQRIFQKAIVPLIIEVASGTNLEAKPGTPTQISFNVKNNINMAVQVFFNAKYNGIAQIVQPTQTVLQPSTTGTVIVNLQPIGITQNTNAVGTLTLFAGVANKVTARSAIISLTSQTIKDNYPPKVTYKYEGDCSNYKEPQICENGHWGIEATFYDEDSGLLKILSEPYGLIFQSEFVAGTKTPVTVYYSATCCQPNAYIWAEDLKGNIVKKSFDVFNQNLLAGEIASIVLGTLIILLIILVIVVAVILYRKRNQRNLIIPRPRSGSR